MGSETLMEFHEAANIFPLDEEHIGSLAEDIKENGLQCPIETIDDKIIDGRRRFLACKKAKVEPEFFPVVPDDPVAYVLSLNLHRRHLSVSQMAMAADRARSMYEAAAKERMKAGGKAAGKGRPKQGQMNSSDLKDTGQARDKLGEAFGIGGATVDTARLVRTRGIPEVAQAVVDGTMSVNRAQKIARKPKEEQAALLQEALKPKARSPKKRTPPAAVENATGAKEQGVGVLRANEAVNSLSRIPKNDALRKRGFQIVTDWIKRNP